MAIKYVHQELNQDVYFPAGCYTPHKEVRLKHSDREILYVIGHASIEASCCGCANWGYAVVPGYIINWQSEKNEAGAPVSEIESISEDTVRKDIRDTIRESENIHAVEFW